ncbi:MAG: hypothetical protein DI587_30250 [Variovorax paradoxus]|nr:MAG: hypothetical protein DI583_30250 [Variovorax paradoxus]PZQ03627.1 MAG: hypothetical protein DI587_30250 [Variovorax paradoxus]
MPPPHGALLIVYHTMIGGTLQMGRAITAGARREQAVDVRRLRVPLPARYPRSVDDRYRFRYEVELRGLGVRLQEQHAAG